MEYASERPIYRQIVERVKLGIISGEYTVGQRLPSIRTLASDWQVNTNTMARAFSVLEAEGVTSVLRGQGSVVANDPSLVDKLRREFCDSFTMEYLGKMSELGYEKEEVTQIIAKYYERGV